MNKNIPLIALWAFLLSFSRLQAQNGCIDSTLIDPNIGCPAVYDPVCGCNGVTYGNSCEAQYFYGVSSFVPGECPVQTCNCDYNFQYTLNGTQLHAGFDFGDIDPPFFFFVEWSLDNGAVTGTGLDFVTLLQHPGIHTLCATYPTGDFANITCTVCQTIQVEATCIDSSLIDLNVLCPEVLQPVCGCDGQTYDNACIARNYYGVSSWKPGACGSGCNQLFVDFEGANIGGSQTMWTFEDETLFPDGTITAWHWDFGNGQTSSLENPSMNFQTPGFYEVCLTVDAKFSDGSSCTGTNCQTIAVAGPACVDPEVIDTTIFCPQIYEPVCGCDGITYPNECMALNHYGVTSWTAGICPGQCINPEQIDTNVFCTAEVDPVCGCDGVTYSNSCIATYYGGVSSWTKGPCCNNPACQALFEVVLLPNNTVYIKNQSVNAEASVLNLGDGAWHGGVFEELTHTYNAPGSYQICLEISNFAGDCSDTHCVLVNFTSATGEPSQQGIDLVIAPNPAHDQAQVQVIGAIPQRAWLFDMQGKRVWQQHDLSPSFQLNAQALPAGLYQLQVQTNRGLIAQKWMVE